MEQRTDNLCEYGARLRTTMAVLAAALLFFYMLCPVAPVRWHDLYLSYGKCAILAMAAIYFYTCGLRGTVETRLVVFYTVWLFLTRLLNTDLYLQNELDLVISRLLCCVVLPVGLLLRPRERLLLLDVVAGVLGAFYFVTALLGLGACILGVYFYLPPEHAVFGLDNSFFANSFNYIVAWETNRTISAVWFYLAWCLMVYAFFRCKRRFWRIPVCLAWFVFHLAIAFCFCRSVKIAVCVNVGMLLILGLRGRLTRFSRPLRTLLPVLLVAVSLPLTYKSFDLLTSATAAVYNAADVQIVRTSDAFIGYPGGAREEQRFDDSRDLRESISTISNRGSIYASVLPTLREDPIRLLIGKYSGKVMDVPHKYQNYPYWHMHNYLLQVLMLTGLPGLALVLAFSVLLVLRMLRLFFSGAESAVKVLTLPLAGVLIYGMFETVLFTDSADGRALTDVRELLFFLLAGIVIAFSAGLVPAGKKRRKPGAQIIPKF